MSAFDAQELVLIQDFPSGYRAQFAPYLVERRGGVSADQPAQATVEDVRSPVPSHAESARDGVRLEDFSLVAVHLQVTAAREASHAATDNENAHPWRTFPLEVRSREVTKSREAGTLWLESRRRQYRRMSSLVVGGLPLRN